MNPPERHAERNRRFPTGEYVDGADSPDGEVPVPTLQNQDCSCFLHFFGHSAAESRFSDLGKASDLRPIAMRVDEGEA